jgi:hypothetical protein
MPWLDKLTTGGAQAVCEANLNRNDPNPHRYAAL